MGVLIGSSSLIESLEFLKCPEFGFFREFDFTNQTFELIQFCFSNWTRFFLFWDSEVDFFESREWMIQLLTLRNKSEILNHLLVSHLVQVWWPRPPSFSRSSWRPRDESRRPWPRDCVRHMTEWRICQSDHVIHKKWFQRRWWW